MAHHAASAVASHHVAAADAARPAVSVVRLHLDARRVLREAGYLPAPPRLDPCPQHRFQIVLRRDLVGLQRMQAVVGMCRLLAGPCHRRIGQHRQWRLGQARHDEDVERVLRRIAERTHVIGESEASKHLHRPGVAALHLRSGPAVNQLVQQQAPDPASTEVDGERQARRTCTDDDHVVSVGFNHWVKPFSQSTLVCTSRHMLSPHHIGECKNVSMALGAGMNDPGTQT